MDTTPVNEPAIAGAIARDTASTDAPSSIRQVLKAYQQPDLRRSYGQLASSFIPYIALWVLMVYSLRLSYWLTLGLAVLAAGFMVRLFIIFHDCGHGSFFESRRANDFWGILTGLAAFTPYYHWRHAHAIHHATAGDLDRRGVGDVDTLTVAEYQALSPGRRFVYRLSRSPFVMFTIGSFLVFAVFHRFYRPGSAPRERNSVLWTNLALAGIIALLVYLIGWKAYLLIQVPVLAFATSAGVWLFYVQHNYQGVYWRRHEEWDFYAAGLHGASYYKLPALLNWFSGNIGYHHIHHLSARIPNYELPRCHRENPEFQVPPLTLRGSLHCLHLRLYDEPNQRMVGFKSP